MSDFSIFVDIFALLGAIVIGVALGCMVVWIIGFSKSDSSR